MRGTTALKTGKRMKQLAPRLRYFRTFFPLSGSLTLLGLTSNMMQQTSIVSFTPFGGVLRLFTCILGCQSGRRRGENAQRRRDYRISRDSCCRVLLLRLPSVSRPCLGDPHKPPRVSQAWCTKLGSRPQEFWLPTCRAKHVVTRVRSRHARSRSE